jgi:hypothetical protein
VRDEGPRLKVERRWGVRWFVGTDLVCAVFEFSRHVGVEFWRGSSLRDSTGLIEGTGKSLRHLKLTFVAAARSPPFRELLREAAQLDRESAKRSR